MHTKRYVDKGASEQYAPAEASAKQRKIYPWSVIYGGAYSSEELNRSRRLDSVVRAHYADFGERSVVKQTPKDLFMYVSYRQSDRVYWTKTKRRIPAGEAVLTDGKNLARTRCGNRLSFVPQQPTAAEKELPEEALNTPETPKLTVPPDLPAVPEIQADLYVPAAPPSTGLLPPPPFSSLPAAGSTGGPALGGAYGPTWASSATYPGGGTPLLGGRGISARNAAVSARTPSTVPIIPVVAGSAPEPGTSALLLVSSLVFAVLAFKNRS